MSKLLNPMASSGPAQDPRSAMSALMDGALDASDAAQAVIAWQRDADARVAWHAYHLIGDVMRSDELAQPPIRDEAFLQALRGKLALEAVPPSPAPLALRDMPPSAGSTRRRPSWWVAPAAVAGGFMAVGSLLVLTEVVSINRGAPGVNATLAQAGGNTAAATRVVRDPNLDRYLEAHRSLTNGVVAAAAADHRVQIVFESK